tara:strand:+ start:2623 stop:2856 length:234 start_codon:yes stop_codon:yes gene_type:complete
MSIYRISNPFGYNNHITIYADNPTIQDLIDKSGLRQKIQLYDIRINAIKRVKPLPNDKTLPELNISSRDTRNELWYN